MTHSKLFSNTGVFILFPNDGDFFKLLRFKAKNRIQRIIVRKLLYVLYADDATLCATSAEQLQDFLSCCFRSCNKSDFTISLEKTTLPCHCPTKNHLTINEMTLENIKKFTHLESTLFKSTTIDQQLSTKQGKASTTFDASSY